MSHWCISHCPFSQNDSFCRCSIVLDCCPSCLLPIKNRLVTSWCAPYINALRWSHSLCILSLLIALFKTWSLFFSLVWKVLISLLSMSCSRCNLSKSTTLACSDLEIECIALFCWSDKFCNESTLAQTSSVIFSCNECTNNFSC